MLQDSENRLSSLSDFPYFPSTWSVSIIVSLRMSRYVR
jgi:hypothetical protein